MSENPERARIAGILQHPAAAKLPKLAETLAMQTDLSAEAADGILTAALADAGATSTAPRQQLPEPTASAGFGLGFPESTDKSPKAADWSKASAGVVDQAGKPPKPDHGWGKAMSYRKEAYAA